MTTAPQTGQTYVFQMSDRLRVARERAGLTVRELEDVTGISRSSIGNYESGKTTPRRPQLVAWAMATGFDLAWIETGEAPVEGDPEGGVRERNARTGVWVDSQAAALMAA